MGAARGQARFVLLVAAVFGGVAVFLVVVGLYGVISYAVGQRRQEMGTDRRGRPSRTCARTSWSAHPRAGGRHGFRPELLQFPAKSTTPALTARIGVPCPARKSSPVW